ncbi:MAG: hypothetical protein EA359_05260 [Balneolaceae bacterium]|nr:MAG: hypothetical protein EA359_05260 [Balneolaceae bacterium]
MHLFRYQALQAQAMLALSNPVSSIQHPVSSIQNLESRIRIPLQLCQELITFALWQVYACVLKGALEV